MVSIFLDILLDNLTRYDSPRSPRPARFESPELSSLMSCSTTRDIADFLKRRYEALLGKISLRAVLVLSRAWENSRLLSYPSAGMRNSLT